jgi:hypothetical protein
VSPGSYPPGPMCILLILCDPFFPFFLFFPLFSPLFPSPIIRHYSFLFFVSSRMHFTPSPTCSCTSLRHASASAVTRQYDVNERLSVARVSNSIPLSLPTAFAGRVARGGARSGSPFSTPHIHGARWLLHARWFVREVRRTVVLHEHVRSDQCTL